MSLPVQSGKRGSRAQSFILIGDGFDELEVVYFLHKFRQAGLPIKSVSLFDKLVYSRQGVGLEADYALADGPFDSKKECLIILPAGGRNGDVLRRDARIKTLLKSLNEGNADIAVTDRKSNLASDVDRLMSRPTYQPDGDQDLGEFVDSLTEHIA
jgi:putative intracellular protease/amidase